MGGGEPLKRVGALATQAYGAVSRAFSWGKADKQHPGVALEAYKKSAQAKNGSAQKNSADATLLSIIKDVENHNAMCMTENELADAADFVEKLKDGQVTLPEIPVPGEATAARTPLKQLQDDFRAMPVHGFILKSRLGNFGRSIKKWNAKYMPKSKSSTGILEDLHDRMAELKTLIAGKLEAVKDHRGFNKDDRLNHRASL